MGLVRSSLLSLLLSVFAAWTEASQFNLPWADQQSVDYNYLAAHVRLLPNDTLNFQNATHSVLLVEKDSYINCNTTNPIAVLSDHTIKLNTSGFYYFISENRTSCVNNKRVILLVLTPRKTPHSAISPKSSSQSAGAPAPTPPKRAVFRIPVGTPSGRPTAPSTTPTFNSPLLAPPNSPLLPPTDSMAPRIFPIMTPTGLPAPGNSPSASADLSPSTAPGGSGSTAGGPRGNSRASAPNTSGAPFRCGSALISLVVFVAVWG